MKKKKENEDSKIQWHPLYYSAFPVDFYDDRENTEFDFEFALDETTSSADIVMIRKREDVPFVNPIGHIFRGHNIVEAKSPSDGMGIQAYMHLLACACLYISHRKRYSDHLRSDITVTLFRHKWPRKLVSYLRKECGCTVAQYNGYKGIFHVTGGTVMFPTQILVGRDLGEEHMALKLLGGTEDAAKHVKWASEFIDRVPDEYYRDCVSQLALFIARKRGQFFSHARKEGGDMTAIQRAAMEEVFIPYFNSRLAEKDEELRQNKEELRQKDEEIAHLREQLARLQGAD